MSRTMQTERDLQDRACALVTGGSRGIGAATVEELAARGWHVAFTARSVGNDAQALLDRIEAAGGSAEAHAVDAADREATDALVSDLIERRGGIAVLVANAGAELLDLLPSTTDEDWDRLLEVDLTSVFRLVRRVSLPMARLRWGRIVLVSSAITRLVAPGQVAYTAAKFGLEGVARTAAVELGKRGITTNCVAPGVIDTAMLRRYDDQFDEKQATARIPAARLGRPEDISGAIGFLVSDAGAYVNGTTLRVDGGLSVGAATYG
jgi:3-oxoacyl-[acyl-carrier protein] reductase